jgi:hypothetical protein
VLLLLTRSTSTCLTKQDINTTQRWLFDGILITQIASRMALESTLSETQWELGTFLSHFESIAVTPSKMSIWSFTAKIGSPKICAAVNIRPSEVINKCKTKSESCWLEIGDVLLYCFNIDKCKLMYCSVDGCVDLLCLVCSSVGLLMCCDVVLFNSYWIVIVCWWLCWRVTVLIWMRCCFDADRWC